MLVQWCLTLCDPMDCRLPGSSVHGISRQESWSGLPFSAPENLLDPGIEPASLAFMYSTALYMTYTRAPVLFKSTVLSSFLSPCSPCPSLPPSPPSIRGAFLFWLSPSTLLSDSSGLDALIFTLHSFLLFEYVTDFFFFIIFIHVHAEDFQFGRCCE